MQFTGPALRPRRKKVVTPVPESPVYMDQSEEYGYSSMGRRRKRRIIPNNAEDQQSVKKAKSFTQQAPRRNPQRNVPRRRFDVSRSPSPEPVRDSSAVASAISRSAHTRRFGSPAHSPPTPSKMQHLIFQRSNGERFTINEQQTLLIRAPSSTPDGPTQLIQIPGTAAIRNPAVLNQLLNSGKLGSGSAAVIVPSEDAPSASEALRQHLAKKAEQPKSRSEAQPLSPDSSAFPAFQFKSRAAQADSMAAHGTRTQRPVSSSQTYG